MTMHWLIRRYLGQKLQEKVAERAAAASSTQESAGGSAADPPLAADVALVFALWNEAGGLVDHLQGVVTRRGPGLVTHEGMLGAARVVVATSGPGREAARRATEAVLRGHRPRAVVTAGFAGGLDDTLRRGDLLLADTVVDCRGGRLTMGTSLPGAQGAASQACHTGTLLSVDQVVRTPAEKRRLGQQYHALAVDMETYAVVEICRQHKVPLLAVRVIHDAVDDQLPREVDHLLRQQTLAGRAGAVTGALWRRPSAAQDMWQLQQTGIEVSQRLALLLTDIVTELANRPDTAAGS